MLSVSSWKHGLCIFSYVYVYVYMCTWVQCLWWSEEGIRYSETGVSRQLWAAQLRLVHGTDSGPLPEQYVPLASDFYKPSFSSFIYFSTGHCFYVPWLTEHLCPSFFSSSDGRFFAWLEPLPSPTCELVFKIQCWHETFGNSLTRMTNHWQSLSIYDPSSTISQQLTINLLSSSNILLCWFAQNLFYPMCTNPCPCSLVVNPTCSFWAQPWSTLYVLESYP